MPKQRQQYSLPGLFRFCSMVRWSVSEARIALWQKTSRARREPSFEHSETKLHASGGTKAMKGSNAAFSRQLDTGCQCQSKFCRCYLCAAVVALYEQQIVHPLGMLELTERISAKQIIVIYRWLWKGSQSPQRSRSLLASFASATHLL